MHSQQKSIRSILEKIDKLLYKFSIVLGDKIDIEISHHYGLHNFYKFGAVIITYINREYCKKLIILFPNQKHPCHYHKKKEETFLILAGNIIIKKENKVYNLNAGDMILIKKKEKHEFYSLQGAIIEEISTKHYLKDSFYLDKAISTIDLCKRKTYINNWKQYFTLSYKAFNNTKQRLM